MVKIKSFVCILLLLCTANLTAQDIFFNNFNQSLIYFNPSFAGSNGGVRNQFTYRNQWPFHLGRFETYMNSFDFYIKPIRGGIAITALTDDCAHGTFKTTYLGI